MVQTLIMRSKPILALIWVASTVVAVAIVWQSLGFVSTRTAPTGSAAPTPTGATTPATAPTGSAAPTTPGATIPQGSVPTGTNSTTSAATAPAADVLEQTFELVGGSTAVRYADGGVTVLWAVPAPGFSVKFEPEGSGQKVEFRSGRHRSRIDVWWPTGPSTRSGNRPTEAHPDLDRPRQLPTWSAGHGWGWGASGSRFGL